MAGAALLGGCSVTVDGKPVGSPHAAAPSHPTRGPAPPPAPTAPSPPPGAIPLQPDKNGYVFIETKSGQTRCQIAVDNVGCEAPFTNSPIEDGVHANGVNITADGTVQWVLGNLGAIPTVTIDYRRYDAQGWTIDATAEGTRFTNDRTGHGMFVSLDKVDTY
ncbi:hypothetical protein MBOT_09340 [Mycobacterium botniense]|uniref:Lipoprotein LpqJ n=1 Tax=Mycobacterium botniense TaxID=84962 RepID=A0A7I9XUE5_9MYCO|nr:hypothetical protein MBOT_09340 [Mycobacterium botniense]